MSELAIISALNPWRFRDDCAIYMKVWFADRPEPVVFVADPFDVEPHGRELWFRAMMGEYGDITTLDADRPKSMAFHPMQRPALNLSQEFAKALDAVAAARRALPSKPKILLSPPEVKNDG